MKPFESEVESSKKVITGLRAHIEALNRKQKLKEKELHGAVEQVRECGVGISFQQQLTNGNGLFKLNLDSMCCNFSP